MVHANWNDIVVFTDGGSRGNPGNAALGVVIETPTGDVLHEYKEFLGVKTNNEAEYLGFLTSIQQLRTAPQFQEIKNVTWKLDSMLVVEQLNKKWKIKEPRIADFAMKIWFELASVSFSYTIRHVPRKENARADALVNQALDEAAAGNGN